MSEQTHLSLPQLAAKMGLHIETVRLHHRKKYLKAERVLGARGLRVHINDAKRWASKYFAKAINLEGNA